MAPPTSLKRLVAPLASPGGITCPIIGSTMRRARLEAELAAEREGQRDGPCGSRDVSRAPGQLLTPRRPHDRRGCQVTRRYGPEPLSTALDSCLSNGG
jgi:hypothetical protein